MARRLLWTKLELSILQDNYENLLLTKEDILRLIPGRPWSSIVNKAMEIGINRNKWKSWQKDYLINNYTNINISTKDIGDAINKPVYCIHVAARKLGLSRTSGYKVNSNFFDKMDSEEKWYIFGLICADGHWDKDTNRISITLQEGDKDILEKVSACLGFTNPLKFKKGILDKRTGNICKNTYSFRFSNKQISEKLNEMGIDNNKTFSLKFYKFCPKEYLRDYIRGYFDGDGCICVTKPCDPSFNIAGTMDMCKNILNILIKYCGIGKPCIQERKNMSVLYVGGRKQILRIREWLYKDASIFMQRKYNKFYEICE